MIFLSGVHGVGKSYFCNLVLNRLGIKSYSASTLISSRRKRGFSADKLIPDIDENQFMLIEAIGELRSQGHEFILDGHFCLLNEVGEITRISSDTYTSLSPDAIILLTEKPETIADRRLHRDGVRQAVVEIDKFQMAEKQYAEEISALLRIPLVVSNGSNDLEYVIEFIRAGGK